MTHECKYCKNLCQPNGFLGDFKCSICNVVYIFSSSSRFLMRTELHVTIDDRHYKLTEHHRDRITVIDEITLYLNPESSLPYEEYKFVLKINSIIDHINPQNIADKIKTLITFS